jgi:hypothetical protein
MKIVLGIGGLLLVGALIASSHHDKTSSSSDAAASPSSQIALVASKSRCVATGVSDVYTGDGRILFLFALRNGGDTGTVNVTPVRHYDDGETNESAMDMMIDVSAPRFTTKRFSSPQYKYKAHEHQLIGCGLRVDDGPEIPIRVAQL